MTAISTRNALLAAALATLVLAGCNRDDVDTTATPTTPGDTELASKDPLPPDPTTPQPSATGEDGLTDGAQTALDVTSVTLGTNAGEDLRITDPATTFGTTGPIIVSVDTAGAASDAEIGVRLVYQDGQDAGEQTETVNTTGMETTNFTFTNAKPWPTGEYTAEVRVNGTPAGNESFTVR